MRSVFLSYSRKDHVFADLAVEKLAAADIHLWRDQRHLLPGKDWRDEIEQSISKSVAVLLVLSSNFAESSYVTFEWAYALGKEKDLIPVKLGECPIHPRLASIQQLDFSVAGSLPWKPLIDRIRGIEIENESRTEVESKGTPVTGTADDWIAKAILAYLNANGFQKMSFERICQNIDRTLTPKQLNEVIINNPTVFRHATLAGEKPGLAKRTP